MRKVFDFAVARMEQVRQDETLDPKQLLAAAGIELDRPVNVRILADGSFLLCYPDCWGPPLYDCLLVPAPGTAPATSDSKAATNPALTAAAVAESISSIGLLSRMRYRLRHAVTAVLRLFG